MHWRSCASWCHQTPRDRYTLTHKYMHAHIHTHSHYSLSLSLSLFSSLLFSSHSLLSLFSFSLSLSLSLSLSKSQCTTLLDTFFPAIWDMLKNEVVSGFFCAHTCIFTYRLEAIMLKNLPNILFCNSRKVFRLFSKITPIILLRKSNSSTLFTLVVQL